MDVAIEEVNTLRRNLKISLGQDMVGPKIEAAYRKLQSEVSLKGFRKGKVPRKVLEKTYGDKVKSEVGEQLIQDTYFDALEDSNLDAVVHPDIKSFDFTEDGAFVYEAEVDLKPEFELGLYKGIEVEHPEIVVTDEEVEKSLELTRKELAPLRVVTDRPAQENDLVIVDFQGYENGEALKAVSGTEYPVDIGSERNGVEFENMIIGLNAGTEATREIDFPATVPNPVLAGKKIEFKLTVKDVKERVLADLDDDFAKDVSDEFSTLEDLKSSITDKIRKEKIKTSEGDISDKVMLNLLENHQFELPGRLVAYEIDQLVSELENNLDKQGLTLESAGLNREELAKQYQGTAEKRVKGEFLLKKIAEKEEIKITDEDMEKGFKRIGDQYSMPVAEVKKFFQRRDELLPFMNELLSEKILEMLRNEAKINYVTPSQDVQEAAE